MKQTFAWRDGQLVEITPENLETRAPSVMADIQGFRSPDGKWIEGRTEWREHLNVTGTIEMGHSDIQAQSEKWNQKKAKHQERLNRNTGDVRPAEMRSDDRPVDRSRVTTEMLNRLDGRPTPDRKTLIKLTLETARDLRRR